MAHPRTFSTGFARPAPTVLFLIAVLGLGGPCYAQASEPKAEASRSTRWFLLCCGLPGDDGHRERLTDACQKTIQGAKDVLGVAPQQMRVLVGDQMMLHALSGDVADAEICTKESVAETLRKLSAEVKPEDSCWIVLLGHAHLYGTSSQFNVLGTDFDQDGFAEWAKPIDCQEQVFWLTTPISGFWIRPLASEQRVIITATEADLEFTGTEMPYALADLLADGGEYQQLEDVDRDGSLSLLDLYLAVNLEIHDRFSAMERLQTEHAQLEDNGDGRGSELQQPYLPVPKDDASEEEDTDAQPEPPKPISNSALDGFRSRHILLEASPS